MSDEDRWVDEQVSGTRGMWLAIGAVAAVVAIIIGVGMWLVSRGAWVS